MGFYYKVSAMWVKLGWLVFKLKGEFYIEFGVLLMIGFWSIENALDPKVLSK